MTSLAKQLQRLAVPHTQSVLSTDKRRASLLFEPGEAATLDRDTIFALGVSGLEQLENVNTAFVEFEATLFNKTSQSWERSLQTKEVNEQLDKEIHRFLIHLSPYFLLKAAHKTLEWLIYRYHIHQYNVDDLLLCALPYHDSNIFVRCLQLLKLQEQTNKWNWLHNSAVEGVPLSRAALTNHCKKDPGFLAFVCEILPKFIKVHGTESRHLQPAVSFFTLSLLGALQYADDITERVLSIVVPCLVRALKSKSLQYKAAAYMILCQALTQTTIKPDVLLNLQIIVAKKMTAELSMEAVATLCVLYQTQPPHIMPNKVFRNLCRVPGLVNVLTTLNEKYCLAHLLGAFMPRLLSSALAQSQASSSDDEDSEMRVDYRDLLRTVLSELPLTDDLAKTTAKSLITDLVTRHREMVVSSSDLGQWRETTHCLLGALERKYPTALDVAMGTTLDKLGSDDSLTASVQELVEYGLSNARYSVVPGNEQTMNVSLCLSHSQASVRILALKQLATLPQAQVDEGVMEMFEDRLLDDSPLVVYQAMETYESLGIAASPTFYTHLVSIVTNGNQTEQCRLKGVQLLCGGTFSSHHQDLLPVLLPQLVVMGEEDVKIGVAREILTSELGQTTELMRDIAKDWLKKKVGSSAVDLNTCLINSLVRCLSVMSEADSTRLVSSMSRVHGPRSHFLLLLLTQALMTSQNTLHWCHTLTTVLTPLLSKEAPSKLQPLSKNTKDSDLQLSWLRHMNQTKTLAPSLCVWSLQKLVTTLMKQKPDFSDVWEAGSVVMVTRDVFSTLVRLGMQPGAVVCRKLVPLLAQGLDTGLLHRLLVHLWTLDSCCPMVLVASFYMARIGWTKSERSQEVITNELTNNHSVLLTLLLSLLSELSLVRSAALDTLSCLKEQFGNVIKTHGTLIKSLLKQREEIVADHTHIAVVVGSLYGHRKESEGSQKRGKKQRELSLSLDELLQWTVEGSTPLSVKTRLLTFLHDVTHSTLLPGVHKLGAAMLDEVDLSEVHLMELYTSLYDDTVSLGQREPAFLVLLRGLQSDPAYQTLFIKQVSRAFFHSLSSLSTQQLLVSRLLDVAVNTTNPDTTQLVIATLKLVKLDIGHIIHELKSSDQSEQSTVRAKRKAGSQTSSKSINYKRLTLLLEVMQGRKKVKDGERMAVALFSLLTRLSQEEHEDTDYCRQLTLTCLHNTCANWTADNKPANEDVVCVEVLVQCLRSGSSPHTQHQALLLMSTLAPLYPDLVLHNIMSVFTFVGSTLVQQDDNYSFQLIINTIDTIIPTLIQSSESRDSTVCDILRVFADVCHFIPSHRSEHLYRHLVTTLGTEENLWVLVALCVEGSVRREGRGGESGEETKEENNAQDAVSGLEASVNSIVHILLVFSPSDQLSALTQLLTLLTALTDAHKGGVSVRSRPPLSVLHLSTLLPRQLRLLQYHATRLVAVVMSNDQIVNDMLVKANQSDSSVAMASLFQSFMAQCLGYMHKVRQMYGSHGDTAEGKFWKAVLNQIYDVIDKVKQLLPSGVFLEAVAGLIENDEAGLLRRKALDLLTAKLTSLSLNALSDTEVGLLERLAGLLVDRSCHISLTTLDSESVASHQLSLFCLKLLCKLMGSEHPDTFIPVFDVVLAVLRCHHPSVPLLNSALLCLAELVSSLKIPSIAQLRSILPALLDVFKQEQLIKDQELVLVCALTVLQRLLHSLSHFISPYLLQIVLTVCELSGLVDLAETGKKGGQAATRLNIIRHQLSTVLPARVLLPVIQESQTQLLTSNQGGVQTLMLILKKHIETISKEDRASHHNVLFTIFTEALDLRNSDKLLLSESQLAAVEESVMMCFLAEVLCLSENAFRPVFYKLYDWASREDDQLHRNRQLVFFALCHKMSVNLKSLFNLFVAHTFKLITQLLERNHSLCEEPAFFEDDIARRSKSCQLLSHLLLTLHQTFTHDTEGFVTPDMFTMLTDPLVNQLENFIGGDEAYQERVSNELVPCISQLAATTHDETQWRALNYEVCLKTRHASAKVRFASLAVLEGLAEKLGDEFMCLLPETIPFLAELMEDDSEEVEQQCQRVVTSLESLLGESLQKYF